MTDPGRSGGREPAGGASDQTEVDGSIAGSSTWERPPPPPVEKSGDPLGGVPIDEPLRFTWSRRRARRIEDPFPTAPVDDPAPVARSLLTERLSGWRKHYFPLPDEVINDYLGSGEQVLHLDHPSFRSFLVDRLLLFLALVAAVVMLVVALNKDWALAGLILLAAVVVLLVVLIFQRIGDRYTSYVITNVRMIRMSGVVSRSIESIPWIRVTDLGFEQSLLERLLGYATLHIESANETMGLRHMRGIADPITFNQHLMDMVVAKQGPAAPLGRRSEYSVLPEHKSLFGRRRRPEQPSPAGGRILDDADPAAGTSPPARDARQVAPGADPAARAAEVERERADPSATDLGDI